MSWPSHFPTNCPPLDQSAYEGFIYRHIQGDTPTTEDFISWAQKSPKKDFKEMQCQACGLSVFIDETASLNIGARVPALRGKKVAKYHFQKSDGVLKHTQSNNNEHHHTWWVDEFFTDIHLKFICI
ncbi:MAG: hypothetical protein HOP21_00040 [Methylotenera sp.]|nr:hypothetical protein [Methylotenera sp.]